MIDSPRPGFTLLELVAALTLAGLALAGAARLLDQLGASHERSGMVAAVDARRMNGLRLLRALTYRADAGFDTTRRFTGAERMTAFRSWCEVPAGWLERCDISLAIVIQRDSSAVVARLGGSSPVALWTGAGSASFRYFDGASVTAGGNWLRGWGISLSLPGAIAIVTTRDTVVLRVGGST
jgi:prepilin-type N-terminal cleavage/methylation domain-containing protein